LLNDREIVVKKHAAAALKFLSVDHATNKDVIRELGGIRPLVFLLNDTDTGVKQGAADALKVLSVDNAVNSTAIREVDGRYYMFEFLVKICQEEKNKKKADSKNYKNDLNMYEYYSKDIQPKTESEKINYIMALAIKNYANSETSQRYVCVDSAFEDRADNFLLWNSVVLIGSILPTDKFNFNSINSSHYRGREHFSWFKPQPNIFDRLVGWEITYDPSEEMLSKLKGSLREDTIRMYLKDSTFKMNNERDKAKKAEVKTKEARIKTEAEAKKEDERQKKGNTLICGIHKSRMTVSEVDSFLDSNSGFLDFVSRDARNITPLAAAVMGGKVKIVECLIKRSANPFLRFNSGADTFKASDWVVSGAAYSDPVMYQRLMEHEDSYQYPKEVSLLSAAKKFDVTLSEIEKILASGANINHQSKYRHDGYTVLMVAVDVQNDRLVSCLLRNNANPLLRNNKGNRASDLASIGSEIHQKLKDAEALLEKTKDELFIDEVKKFDVTLSKIKQLLVGGANINYQSKADGDTALMIAVDAQNDRLAEYLLKQSANPWILNRNGEKASDLASRNSAIYSVLKGYELFSGVLTGDINHVTLALNTGADVNFKASLGYTALLAAVEAGNLAIVKLLLSRWADISITCDNGRGPFELVRNRAISKVLSDYKNQVECAFNADQIQEDQFSFTSSSSSARQNPPSPSGDREDNWHPLLFSPDQTGQVLPRPKTSAKNPGSKERTDFFDMV